MGKFTEDATKLLEYVGGPSNINAITHCVTRMRFVLADPKKANIKKIEALPSAKGTFTQAGQFQVIIGNEVADFYKEFTAIAGIEGVSKDAAKSAAKDNTDEDEYNEKSLDKKADYSCYNRNSDSSICNYRGVFYVF